MALAPEVARRIAGDASLQVVLEGEAGSLGVGRRSRTILPLLTRLLRRRDGG